MGITLGTTFAEEVVIGLVYLGITNADSVEYSVLIIDGEDCGHAARLHVPFRR